MTSRPTAAFNSLADAHVKYLLRQDAPFRQWWRGLSIDSRQQKQDHLYHLNRLALLLPAGEDGSYSIACKRCVDSLLKHEMLELPDEPFGVQPGPLPWAQSARTRAINEEACRRALSRARQSLQRTGVVAEVYGGLKPTHGIRQKVKAFEASRQSLDLWDMIRLRVVAKSLGGVAAIATELNREYGEAVVRFRNYYTHPRNDEDLYRAIHLIVREGDRFVEVQLMTASRELVCELDHAVAFKRCLAPLSRSHLNWLRRLSLAANSYDVSLSRRVHTKPSNPIVRPSSS